MGRVVLTGTVVGVGEGKAGRITALLAASCAAALLVGAAAAQGRSLPNTAPPVPGGVYKGHNKLEKRVVLRVSTEGRNGTIRGTLRLRCVRGRAHFKTDDGRFVAKKRSRSGRLVLRARGRFAAIDRAKGRVTKARGGGRRCVPSRFKARLREPAGVRSKTIRYGPFDVPEPMAGEDMRMKTFGDADVERSCANCYVIGMVPDLVYANGKVANFNTGAMLHHVVFGDQSTTDATCPSWPERFFAAGNERTDFVLPRGYGYRVSPNARWGALVDLMNMADRAQSLYVEVTFYYVARRAGIRGVEPLWLDVDNCRDSEYAIPAGRSDTHWSYRVPASNAGDVVAMGGHLHNYGVRIKAEDVTTGKRLCTSRAGFGRNPAYMGNIESMSGCVGEPLGRIHAGDVLRLHSIYDSPEARDDVMGIMLAYVDTGGGR